MTRSIHVEFNLNATRATFGGTPLEFVVNQAQRVVDVTEVNYRSREGIVSVTGTTDKTLNFISEVFGPGPLFGMLQKIDIGPKVKSPIESMTKVRQTLELVRGILEKVMEDSQSAGRYNEASTIEELIEDVVLIITEDEGWLEGDQLGIKLTLRDIKGHMLRAECGDSVECAALIGRIEQILER